MSSLLGAVDVVAQTGEAASRSMPHSSGAFNQGGRNQYGVVCGDRGYTAAAFCPQGAGDRTMKSMIRRNVLRAACVAAVSLGGVFALAENGPPQPWSKWRVHDTKRPMAPVVTPGTVSTAEQAGKAPSDAIVLFDGSDMSHWQAKGGGEPTFTLQDALLLSTNLKDRRNNKYLQSKEEFGDVQVHLEWSEPNPPKGSSQGRGNSGVFLMGLFEVQVLDDYNNPTYADGQCSAVYGQYPPQVNVCKPPGEWQTYDIIFTRPRYEGDVLKEPAYVTVLQNGVLTQNHQRIEGPTGNMIVAKYSQKVPDKAPLELQYHNDIVRFRNIWVRPLEAIEHQQMTGEVPAAPTSEPSTATPTTAPGEEKK
jgi:hypothetical protein